MASSVAEALKQRLDIYKEQEQAAKDQGNNSKARRMGRIVKQYEDAIKRNNAGKSIPVDELPTPPGFGPIPVEGAAVPPKPELPKMDPKPSVARSEDPSGIPTTTSPLPSPTKPGKFCFSR